MNTINKTTMTDRILALVAIGFVVATVCTTAQTKKKSGAKQSKKPAAAAQAPAQAVLEQVSDKPNLDVRPAPLAGTAWQFPPFREFTLPSGLHVYVVENHELPTLNISIVMRGGDAYDPVGKEGTAALAGDMLGKGTKSYNAQQIAETLDGVGANISVSTSGEAMTINASSLKKHASILLNVLSEQLREPLFNEDELAKLKQQYQAGIASRRGRPVEIAQALSRKVVYGMDNPLARRQTEKSVSSVTRADLVQFHASFVRPNIASIAFVGDVTEKEVREYLKKHFSSWEKGTRPAVDIPDMKTEPAGVYFVPRKGSVQSTVMISAAGPPVRADDFMATDVMVSNIGSGFGSILFNTLRETYSYTYSPFALLTRGRRYNRIAFGAEVRTSVTDSAIAVMLREIRKLVSEGPDESAIERRIAAEVGQYQIAFERPATVGAVLQNAWVNDVPLSEVTTFTDRLSRVTVGDVQLSAAQYLSMFNLRLIVVGAPEVRTKLEQFGAIREFTLDLEPADVGALEPVALSAKEVIDGYVRAIGGSAALAAITNVVSEGSAVMVMQGRELTGTYSRIVAVPNKEKVALDLGPLRQQQWVNGSTAWVAMGNGPAGEQSAEDTKKLILEARIFPFASLLTDGYKVEVKGKRNGQIVLEALSPLGRTDRFYVDASTMLLLRSEKDEQTPKGPITTSERYEDYTEIAGVKLPATTIVSNSIYSITTRVKHTVNSSVPESEFTPAR